MIKLYTLKSSRKISTLIFGQRQQAFFYLDCIKARGAYFRAHAPRFYFILLKLYSPRGFHRADVRRIKWHKKSQRAKTRASVLALGQKKATANLKNIQIIQFSKGGKNHFFEKLKITKTPISSQNRRRNVALSPYFWRIGNR